jgi:hypothetical protein
MPRPPLPTFVRHGQTLKLTKREAQRLASVARQHGHQNEGYQEGAHVVSVRCPLCRDKVTGHYAWQCAATTATQALDRAMLEHLEHDCGEVKRP